MGGGVFTIGIRISACTPHSVRLSYPPRIILVGLLLWLGTGKRLGGMEESETKGEGEGRGEM